MTREEEKRGENILLFLVYNQEAEAAAAETFWTTIDLCVLCVNKGASGRKLPFWMIERIRTR